MISDFMVKLGRNAHDRAQVNPWTNVYGFARSLIAMATAATLLFNPAELLFYPKSSCEGLNRVGLICMLGHHDELGRWIMIVGLLVVASGWRPRITGVFHWWFTFSFWAATRMGDGGEVLAMNITLLLIPVTLTDSREWHWSSWEKGPEDIWGDWARLLALSALWLVRLQVAYLYFQSSIAKLDVTSWTDGTALYYWVMHPLIGAPFWLRSLLRPILLNGAAVTLLTWGTILLEIFLFLGILLPKRSWRYLLAGGLMLHAAIGVVFGIVTFSTIMAAALVLYLRPVEEPFAIPLHLIRTRRVPVAVREVAPAGV